MPSLQSVNSSGGIGSKDCLPGLAKVDCHGDCPKPEVIVDPAYQVFNSLNPLILDSVNNMAREFQFVTVVADAIARFIGFSGGAYEAQGDCYHTEFDGEYCRTQVSGAAYREVFIVDGDDGEDYTGDRLYPGQLLTPTLQGAVVSNDFFAPTSDPALAVAVVTRTAPCVCGNCEQPVCPVASADAAADGASPTAALAAYTNAGSLKAHALFQANLNIGYPAGPQGPEGPQGPAGP